jgi:CBS domain containing-hemolysin-like protein
LTTAWLLLGVAVVLVVGNAIFVAAETGLVTVDRIYVESRARQGDRRFQRIAGTLRRLSTYLSGAQLGITVTSLAIGLEAEPSAAQLLRGPLEAVGLGNEEAEVVAVAIALLVATAVQMVFGELVPKNIALSRPIGTVSCQIFASRICFELHSLKNVGGREAQFFIPPTNSAFVRIAVEIICWVFICSHTLIQTPCLTHVSISKC